MRRRERRLGEHPAKEQPERSELLNQHIYCTRNRVERFFNKIKHCRRVATRYDKLAANCIRPTCVNQTVAPALIDSTPSYTLTE